MHVATAVEPAASTDRQRPAVAWLTVIPLAVAMSAADDYWTTSLRGAFGAIERTQDPFTSWVRDSLVLTPLFTAAVLAGMVLVVRRPGRGLLVRYPVTVAALLIAVAGTVVGLVVLGVSSAYDYMLQGSQLQVMDTMRDLCASSDCLQTQRHATLVLQERSFLLGAGLILCTNVVLVALVVAFRGGELPVSAERPRLRARHTGVGDLRLVLAVGLAGSAVIHAAVVPEHVREWPAAGAFFVVLAAAELGVAAVLMARPSADTVAAAVISAGPLVLWLCSRTFGLPLGPEPGVAEAVGLADVSASLLEVATLVVAVVLMVGRKRPGRSAAAAPHARWLAFTLLLAVTTVGFSGSGVAGFDSFSISPAGSSTTSGHHH